jgi:hypothetical protein
MDLVRKFPRQKVPLLRQFHYFSIFEIDLNRNISTGQCCGSAFDLSPLADPDADFYSMRMRIRLFTLIWVVITKLMQIRICFWIKLITLMRVQMRILIFLNADADPG